MKKLAILLFSLMFSVVIAQEDTTAVDKSNCDTWLSVSHEFVKAKNYKEAYPTWKKLHDQCPGFHKAIYVDGVKIYQWLMKNTDDEAKKKEYAEKMIRLYDERVKYFPQEKAKALHMKGVMMVVNKVGTPEEIYEVLNEVFTNYPDQFTHPKAYLGLFKGLVSKYKKGDITLDELFSKYDDLTEHLDAMMEKLTKKMEALQSKKETGELTSKESKKLKALEKNLPAMDKVYLLMDNELGDLGDCGTLVPFYSNNFEANKTDVKWLKRAANRLASKDCTKGQLFKKIVEALHKLEPSATSARFLAIRYKKEGNYSKALSYYRQALDLEKDPYNKAKILYSMAVMAKKQGNKPKARNLAREALKYKPSMGPAYLLIASLYAASANECGNTKFEKTAIYWKAAEMARKAAAVDPTIKRKALSIAAEYEKRAPSKKDIFLEGMGGKLVKFDKCWVGGSVRVPSN